MSICEYAREALSQAQEEALAEINVPKTVGCGHPNGCPVSFEAISNIKGFVSGQNSGGRCALGVRLPKSSEPLLKD